MDKRTPTERSERDTVTIDIQGPSDRPYCGHCLDPQLCLEQGGCCFPPIIVLREKLLHESSPQLEALAAAYRGLYRAFDFPRRYWWDRIPYACGWLWRVPYGWYLTLRRKGNHERD